jgi:hypothetical protein
MNFSVVKNNDYLIILALFLIQFHYIWKKVNKTLPTER